jgi:hypothetical protein
MTHHDAHEHHLAVRREALAALDAMSRREYDRFLKRVYFAKWGCRAKAKGSAK